MFLNTMVLGLQGEGVVLHWIHVGFRALREVWWFALGTCALRGEG